MFDMCYAALIQIRWNVIREFLNQNNESVKCPEINCSKLCVQGKLVSRLAKQVKFIHRSTVNTN